MQREPFFSRPRPRISLAICALAQNESAQAHLAHHVADDIDGLAPAFQKQ